MNIKREEAYARMKKDMWEFSESKRCRRGVLGLLRLLNKRNERRNEEESIITRKSLELFGWRRNRESSEKEAYTRNPPVCWLMRANPAIVRLPLLRLGLARKVMRCVSRKELIRHARGKIGDMRINQQWAPTTRKLYLTSVIGWKREEGNENSQIIRTPNILATNHLFPCTLDQYFINSLCAPSTLSTISSVFASMRW
jgi:hypothetical protein